MNDIKDRNPRNAGAKKKYETEVKIYLPQVIKDKLAIKAKEQYTTLSALSRQILIEYLNS